jgi:hypothetical protein
MGWAIAGVDTTQKGAAKPSLRASRHVGPTPAGLRAEMPTRAPICKRDLASLPHGSMTPAAGRRQ